MLFLNALEQLMQANPYMEEFFVTVEL